MYRNFNNTFKEVTVEEVVGSVDKNSKLFIDTQRQVNRRNFEMGVTSPTYIEFEDLRYTFGVELETVGGSVSKEESDLLNLKTDFDGSLRGPDGEEPTGAEYVTGVLTGDTGLKQLYLTCKTLSKNCVLDRRCSVHLHIGSLNWGKEETVYAYILATLLEHQIFSMLPPSRRNNVYCRKLSSLWRNSDVIRELKTAKETSISTYNILIEKLFSKVFYEVSGGVPESNSCNKSTNHPKGSKCGYSKQSQRYCWLNFVTLLFNTKGSLDSKTLEIRNHGASLNYKKIKNWLKFWMAFCNYVDNNKAGILNNAFNLSVHDIVDFSYKRTGKLLNSYILERISLFTTSDEEVDYVKEEHNKTTLKEIISP